MGGDAMQQAGTREITTHCERCTNLAHCRLSAVQDEKGRLVYEWWCERCREWFAEDGGEASGKAG
jgi:hypothetical protein